MKPLPQNYDHKEAEPRLQKHWEETRVYAWDESQSRENTFVIDTPPPTVSGVLHMGHIFSYTQADFVARYQRMSGKTVFYPMGFDDNGLPTERLVEKVKGKKASQYPSREEFIKDCREVVQGAEEEFRKLFKDVALSVDWDQEYQTISDDVRKLSQASFLDLLKKGEAYRKLQPMLWDPVDQTAIAQAEIVDKETSSYFTDIAFTSDSGEELVIGTTRPELLPACVALFYHPDDTRYQHLKGKHATVPLFGSTVPIYEDNAVEQDKGTGLMMCCTFGDEADIQKWQKHNLPTRIILNKYGKINLVQALAENTFNMNVDLVLLMAELEGKKVSNTDPKHLGAREIILDKLKNAGFIKKQIPITHTVKCAERSGAALEFIPTQQWFIKVLDKKEALKAKATECNWYPQFMKIRMDQWIDGLNWDWCISRQRFFGVPFPVWYKSIGGGKIEPVYANVEELPVDPLNGPPKGYKILAGPIHTSNSINPEPKFDGWWVEDSKGNEYQMWPDTDVMDTWATSSITPQINARSIGQSEGEKPSPSGRGLGEGLPKRKLPLSQEFLSRVHELRRNTTDAEQFMWSVLRDRQMEGFKFRRQHPIAPYVVDFFSHEASLIIELDGGQHNENSARAKDERRTCFLESKGYRVLRFWNNDVLGNIEGVFEIISQALAHVSPHPNPLPEGEGTLSTGSRYAKLFPADLRPQAHEIIRTWAFYTIVKAHLHSNTIPWKNLMISGWCLASDKTKMSKSKGNVVTPVDLIIEKGADVVRYWASTSRLGADTAFSEDLLKIGRKLVTKLWNATAFAAIHLTKIEGKPTTAAQDVASGRITETLDKWILTRLHKTIAKATLEFGRFEYCDARVAVEEFFWKDFCDNYLELVKGRAYGEVVSDQWPVASEEKSQATDHRPQTASAHLTLYYCLDAILRLFAPFLPHITEELYSHIFEGQGSVHQRGTWPSADDYPLDEAAEKCGKDCVTLLELIRKEKSVQSRSIKFPIKVLTLSKELELALTPIQADLQAAGNIEKITYDSAFEPIGFNIVWGEQAEVA